MHIRMFTKGRGKCVANKTCRDDLNIWSLSLEYWLFIPWSGCDTDDGGSIFGESGPSWNLIVFTNKIDCFITFSTNSTVVHYHRILLFLFDVLQNLIQIVVNFTIITVLLMDKKKNKNKFNVEFSFSHLHRRVDVHHMYLRSYLVWNRIFLNRYLNAYTSYSDRWFSMCPSIWRYLNAICYYPRLRLQHTIVNANWSKRTLESIKSTYGLVPTNLNLREISTCTCTRRARTYRALSVVKINERNS